MDGSFVNNFWGKDEAKSSEILFHRVGQGVETCNQLIDFYKSKIEIEKEYANKLKQLSKRHENHLGSSENGTIKTALDVLREQFGNIGDCHLNEAVSIEAEILKPLNEFQNFFVNESSQIEKITKQLLKSKQKLFKEIEVCKMEYYNNCMQAYKHYSSTTNSNINQQDIAKRKQLERKITISKEKYETATERYKQVSNEWVNQWQLAANNLQDLEIDRMNNLKTNSWNLINLISMTCVKDDTCCEKARLALENCDLINDIKEFVENFKTGSEIYEAPEFMDFGESQSKRPIDDNEDILDTLMEEDDRYVNANFNSSFNSRVPSLIASPKLRKKPLNSVDSAATLTLEKPLLSFKLDEKNLNEDYNNNISQEKDIDDISAVAPLKFNSTANGNAKDKRLLASSTVTTKHREQSSKVLSSDGNLQTLEIKSPFGTITTTSPVRRSNRKSSPTNSAATTATYSNVQSSPTTSHSSGPFSSASETGFSSASSNVNDDAFRKSTESSNSKWTPGSYAQSKRVTTDDDMRKQQQRQQKNHEVEKKKAEVEQDEAEIQVMRTKLKHYEDELKMRKIQNEMLLQKQHQEQQVREFQQRQFDEELLKEKMQEDQVRKQQLQREHVINNIQQLPPQQAQINNKIVSRMDANNNIPRPKSMIEVAKLNNPKAFELLEDDHNIHQAGPQRHSQPPNSIPLAPNGLPLYSSDGKPVLRYAKAKYDYRADAAGEISFRRKDIMLVLEMQDDGWWLVELFYSRINKADRFGFVPSNYLVPF